MTPSEAMDPAADRHPWWMTGVIYQIYPRSFLDANDDGVGDLRGIARQLDYLQQLGVDAIWTSPIYPSPMVDFGYDISDYCGIDPIFGTMDDFDELLAETHRRGMKLILDLVPNHTSDQHPWFVESKSSRDSPKRDWYIWRDPAPDGGPPNNWRAVFGGSAWEFDSASGQYYYHAYFREQPDLNWRNPDVRNAIADVMRFWFRKGVDGFRIDVLWHLIKDEQFRDDPPNPDYSPNLLPYYQLDHSYSCDQPEVHDAAALLRRVADEFGDRVLIGEIYLPVDRLMAYYGAGLDGVHLPFNFQLIGMPWDAQRISAAVSQYEASLPEGAWPNWVLGNHDKARLASRIGPENARAAAVLLLTLRGTPTIYYGDEIGMTNLTVSHSRALDPTERDSPGFGRDPSRSPMQWTPARNAGFTAAEPWLPVPASASAANVESLRSRPDSILSLYKNLLGLRRAEPALRIGRFIPLSAESPDIFAYRREGDTSPRRFTVAINFGSSHETFRQPHGETFTLRTVLSSLPNRPDQPPSTEIPLRPHEAVIAECES